MNPIPENVEGKVVENHEFRHSVEHRVNWSHIMVAIVVVAVVAKVGPIIAETAQGEEQSRR